MRLQGVNWNDLKSVMAYARSIGGKGQWVIKVPGRQNYNICHAIRLWHPATKGATAWRVS